MSFRAPQPISGHVFRREGERRPVWYAKYRLPDGRQIQRRIGPAWTARGRPAEGSYARRTAQAWLDQASIALSGVVLGGSLPPRALRLVRAWASQHETELMCNWVRARQRQRLDPVDPLP
jgi:hypothetical protein